MTMDGENVGGGEICNRAARGREHRGMDREKQGRSTAWMPDRLIY